MSFYWRRCDVQHLVDDFVPVAICGELAVFIVGAPELPLFSRDTATLLAGRPR